MHCSLMNPMSVNITGFTVVLFSVKGRNEEENHFLFLCKFNILNYSTVCFDFPQIESHIVQVMEGKIALKLTS